jgi:hypothetical protein
MSLQQCGLSLPDSAVRYLSDVVALKKVSAEAGGPRRRRLDA